MIEIEHLLFLCAWIVAYLVLQLCTWIILRAWLSPTFALPASFAASLLCSCLISWYLTWFGFPPEFTLGVYFIFTGIVLAEVQKVRVGIVSDLKEGKWYYALFFIVFATMLVVRMFNPNIDYRSEKFMDHAFLASIMRIPAVPPYDPWMSDHRLTIYYYLGHWCFATLGIIARIPSWFAFQFIIPTVASVSAVQLYGVGKLLLKKFPLLPVACLFLMSPAFVYDYMNGVGISALLWRSSRIIPDTINEYPGFTFLCGDAHAPGMTVFNQCFFIFVVVYIFTQWKIMNRFERGTCTMLAGISLGTMPGLHSWDTFFYGMVFCFVAITIWYQTYSEEDREGSYSVWRWIWTWCTHLYTDIVGLFADLWKKRNEISDSRAALLYLWILVPMVAILSYAPFLLMMTPEAIRGFGWVDTTTTVPQFLLMFGWFVFLHMCTLCSDIKKRPSLLLIAVPFIIAGYPLIGIIFTLLAYLLVKHKEVPDILVFCSLLLILLGELVYLIDFTHGGPGYRTNTIFRLYIAAWLLFGVGSICNISIHAEQFINRVCHDRNKRIFEKIVPTAVIICTLLLILAAPLIEWKTNYESYDRLQDFYGFAWLKRDYPDDYAAIEYLWKLPKKQYVLIEQEGWDYGYSARMSMATGMSAVLGWTHHEAIWRGDKPPGWYGERTGDVRTIYLQPERALEIMEKYKADFLILGALERKAYEIPDDISAYPPDLVPVFTAGETTIYQRVQK